MQARLRITVAAVSAASLLVLVVLTRNVGASIVVDNDVSIDWTNQPLIVSATIVGAPRLVRDWSNVKITVELLPGTNSLGTNSHGSSELQLSFYRPGLCSTPNCGLTATLAVAQTDQERKKSYYLLSDAFTNDGKPLERNLDLLPTPGILIIRGRLHASVEGGPAMVRITVSGDGDPVFIDRIGDDDHFQPGGIADVPPRSVELTRALNQIEASLFPKHAVELDAARSSGAQIATGWTHTFQPRLGGPGNTNLKTALLTFRLLSGDPCSSRDIILLDRGVHNAATGRRLRVPFIYLRDLQDHAPNNGCPTDKTATGEYDFHIDLASVPIRFLLPDNSVSAQPTILNLLGDLDDGQLNVIVAGRSSVDFSDLMITLNGPSH